MDAPRREAHVRTGTLTLEDDGIVYVRVHPKTEMELADAQESLKAFDGLSEGRRCPILVDLSGIRSISREARLHFAGPEAARCHSAMALLIGSPLSRAVGNFFLG